MTLHTNLVGMSCDIVDHNSRAPYTFEYTINAVWVTEQDKLRCAISHDREGFALTKFFYELVIMPADWVPPAKKDGDE